MKRVVQYIVLAVMVMLLASAALWADYCSQLESCKSVDVVILNDDSVTFVTPEGIIREFEVNNIYPEGKLVASLDTDSMERVLDRCRMLCVEYRSPCGGRAPVYAGNEGV